MQLVHTVMCTNIYTLYSQRKCLADKQTQEKQASVAVPSLIQLSTYCAQKYDVNLRVSTVDSKTQCLATARWAWCFFLYIFSDMSYFPGSGLKFRTVLYTLHCPAEKAVHTHSEAL